jgi:hypothetical protein
MLGFNVIAAVVDTMTHPSHITFESIPQTSRIVSLCQSTLYNNIILIGFD